MATKRVSAAPKFQWAFETGKLFKLLSPDGKDKTFRAFMNWFSAARQRGADYANIHADTTGMGEDERDCLASMIDNASAGLEAYWSRCAQDDERPSETGLGGSQADNKQNIYSTRQRPLDLTKWV